MAQRLDYLMDLGLCGKVSPNGQSTCIMDLNHNSCCGWVLERIINCELNEAHGQASPGKIADHYMCQSCKDEFLAWVKEKRGE